MGRTLGEMAGPDGIQAERDEDRLTQAFRDHETEHGCKDIRGCPIRRIIAQAMKDMMLYSTDLLKEANSATEPLVGFVETHRNQLAQNDERTPPGKVRPGRVLFCAIPLKRPRIDSETTSASPRGSRQMDI